jgi:hypothetical protein
VIGTLASVSSSTIRVTVEHEKGIARGDGAHQGRRSAIPSMSTSLLTAVVTDGDGRFVSGLKAEDAKALDNDRAQKITSFSRRTSHSSWSSPSTSVRACGGAAQGEGISEAVSEGLRPRPGVAARLHRQRLPLAPRSRDQAARQGTDLMRA